MRKLFVVALSLTVLAAIAPGAQADVPGTAKISIRSIPSVYGYVRSSRTNLCAGKRRVVVYRKRSGKDKKLASTKTRKLRGVWQWSIKRKPKGKIYAKANAKIGCSTGSSKAIRVKSGGGTPIPRCPGVARGICSFGGATTGLQLTTDIDCRSFQVPSYSCDGVASGGPPAWRNDFGTIEWDGSAGDSPRKVSYANSGAFLEGSMSGFRSTSFSIKDAFAPGAEGIHFCTPNLPGKAAGAKGGRLHFGFTEADDAPIFSIYGYLVKRSSGKYC